MKRLDLGTFYLIDRETNVVLLRDVPEPVCRYVSSCILDSKVRGLGNAAVEADKASATPGHWRTYVDGYSWRLQSLDSLPTHTKQRADRAALLARGYNILATRCSRIRHQYDQISLLEQKDLGLYVQDRQALITLAASALKVPEEQAAKQLELEYSNLQAAKLREIEIRWMFGESLRKVRTKDELTVWIRELMDTIVGIGCV